MIEDSATAQTYPGWTIAQGDNHGADAQLPRRRWRILHNAKPPMGATGPAPGWIKTPDDFVHWLAVHLSVNELYTYFRDLEAIAKMSCDLELLRFARRYLHSNLTHEFADTREQI
ncbi:MAG TPA: hypothetical protein VGL83_03695 [Stellaceae bacterium]|jgi:hypothetical protein